MLTNWQTCSNQSNWNLTEAISRAFKYVNKKPSTELSNYFNSSTFVHLQLIRIGTDKEVEIVSIANFRSSESVDRRCVHIGRSKQDKFP